MTDRIPFADLDAHARAAWTIAGKICTCANRYHAIHPIFRAIGFAPGIATDRAALNEIIPALVAPGARILVAGAADACLIQYLAENCPARPLSVTVVDRCPSPLALIGRLELPAGITVETHQGDLTELPDSNRYDLVLSHDMMNFVDEAARLAVIRRLSGSLKPAGRLILVARIAQDGDGLSPEAEFERHVERAESKLANFPDLASFCGEALPDLLRKHLLFRTMRPGKVRQPEEISRLIEQAGSQLDQHIAGARREMFVLDDGSARQRQSHIYVIRRP